MALPVYVLEAKGMGRERGVRGVLFGDSEHRRKGGRWSAPNGHCSRLESS